VAVSLPADAIHLFDEHGHALERRIPIADMQVPHAA
jgi:multiple sugar transport system ATP-binding protein